MSIVAAQMLEGMPEPAELRRTEVDGQTVITVALETPTTPTITQALRPLIDELNTTPPNLTRGEDPYTRPRIAAATTCP